MKRSLKNLSEFRIKSKDEEKGKVKDFLFDEKKWVIRYLHVEFGTILADKKILIENSFLDKPDWEQFIFPVKLTKSEIENAPELKDHLPISAKYEEEYNKHYRIDNYWDLPPTVMSAMYPPRPMKVPTIDINEKELGTNLRSFNEVENYIVHATDGKFGSLYDLIVDDEDWQVVYVIIDTSKWMPWSKKVIIPIHKLEEISYVNSEMKINLSIETIKNAPEYNEKSPFKSDFEKSLYEFYINTL